MVATVTAVGAWRNWEEGKQGAGRRGRMERMGEGGMRADGGGRYSDFQLYFIFLRDPNCKVNPRFPQLKLGVGGGKWAGF